MKYTHLIIAAFSVLTLVGCQDEVIPSADGPKHSNEVSEGIVPGILRIQVSEELALKWLESADEDGNILEFSKEPFGNLDVTSVSTSFFIGGKFRQRQYEAGLHRWFDIRYEASLAQTKSVGQMRFSSEVHIAEPIYRLERKDVPVNDPHYLTYQWHYDNTGAGGFTPDIDIDLPEAWAQYGVYGNPDVIVAVVDSGVEYSHEDLNANMWVNEAELYGVEGVDDDGNGYKDDIYGYNFAGGSAKINFDSHGTHVAGTIAAVNNNGIGVSGIAGGYYPDMPGVRIMTLQVLDDLYPQAQYNLLRVYQYATEGGAVILNNSWGYEQTLKNMPSADKTAIDYFIQYAGLDENGNQTGPMVGGLAIFAAGNESEDLCYPAAYEKVMAVAAIGPNGVAAYYTNYGEWVDICAPGGDHKVDREYGGIYSIGLNNTYATMQGTSMACPHVSGVAALVLSSCGGNGYTNQDLWDSLINGADASIYDYNPDMQGMLGVGMLNAPASFGERNTVPPADLEFLSLDVQANTVYVTADVPADDTGDAYYYHVYYSKSAIDASDLTSCDRLNVTISRQENVEGGKRRFPVKGLEFETTYHFAVVAGDFAGNHSAVPCMAECVTGTNTPPEITVLTQGMSELKPWESTMYVFTASDKDDFHTVTCSMDDAGVKGAVYGLLPDGTHYVKLDATKMGSGSHTLYFKAVDQYGGESVHTIVVNVLANNTPEVVREIDPVILNGRNQQVSIVVADYFADADGEPLAITASSEDKSIVTSAQSSGKVNLTSKGFGATKVTVTVKDASGASASQTFDVIVRDDSVPYDLYPNPVSDVLNIRAGEAQEAIVTIVNSTGRQVFQTETSLSITDVFSTDLSSLAPGLYTVRINPEGKEEYSNVIVKL